MMAGRMVARSKGLLPVRNPLLHGLLHGCYMGVKRQQTSAAVSNTKFGSGTEIRTPNLAVNSRLLYRLSYPGSEMEF